MSAFLPLLALPLSLQAEPPRFGISPVTIDTPEERTEPIIDYTCRAEAVDGRRLSFTIRYNGTRGYRDPASGEVKATKASATFGGRDASLFSGYDVTAWRQSIDLISDRSDAYFGKWIEIEFPRTQLPYQESAPYRVGLNINFKSMPELLRATGFCDQVYHAQAPLAQSEIREPSKQ